MKYFCLNKERNGSCYHEYQKGNNTENNWSNTSVFIDDDISREIGMDDMNFNIIKSYDPYSAMRYIITMETWNRMLEYANKAGGDLQAALLEIKPWVDENFRLEKYFTIITI